MYIRIKKRKTKLSIIEYAYEAKNVRTKKGPRQKIVSYLGKVHYLKNSGLILPFYLSTDDIEGYFLNKGLKNTVEELLIFELIRHGFYKNNKALLSNGLKVNLDDKTVINENGGKLVLGINKGYLCSKTLKKCFDDIENSSDTKKLIKSLLLIGLDPEESSFTQIFRHKI